MKVINGIVRRRLVFRNCWRVGPIWSQVYPKPSPATGTSAVQDLRRFFEDYKSLDGRETIVHAILPVVEKVLNADLAW